MATGHQDHLSQASHELGRPQAFASFQESRDLENDFKVIFLVSLQVNWDLKTTLSVMFNSTRKNVCRGNQVYNLALIFKPVVKYFS